MTIARDGTLTSTAARELLLPLPVRWPWMRDVQGSQQIADVVPEIPAYPVVIKAEGIAHRQQLGAVWRHAPDPATASAVLALFGDSFGYPLSITEQIPHDVEYSVGWQRRDSGEDALMFGFGGTGIGDDVHFRLAPLIRRQAAALVAECEPDAARRAALIRLILALQALMPRLALSAQAQEIDLNPVTFDASGRLTALDWKIFQASDGAAGASKSAAEAEVRW